MKFEEALPKVREGKRIAREIWKRGYVHITPVGQMEYVDLPFLSLGDIGSDDWKVLDDITLDPSEIDYLNNLFSLHDGDILWVCKNEEGTIRFAIRLDDGVTTKCGYIPFAFNGGFKAMEVDEKYTPEELGLSVHSYGYYEGEADDDE